ncbi:MAG: hypothetical protein FJ291_13895 [Planctomycetes bacterium]|nr:hypothetical protein [Planctomycetota bacterium]
MLTLRREQMAALRGPRTAEALAKSLKDSGLRAEADPASGDVVSDDALGNRTRYGLDQHGFVGSVTSPLGRQTTLTNDAGGKLVGMATPSGLTQGFEYGHDGELSAAFKGGHEVFRLTRDGEGRITSAAYPDRTGRRFDYGANGLIAAEHDRLGRSELYEYSDQNDLVALTDGNGESTSFEYGACERPDSVTFADGSREMYEYDDDGRVSRISNDAGPVAELRYDPAGNVAQVLYADGETVSFVYDGQGRVTEASNRETSLRYEYDDKGRLAKEAVGGKTTVAYSYDENGNLAGMTYPSGGAVGFGRDADLRLSSIKDWAGRVHTVSYDAGDRGETVTSPEGVATANRRTEAGLLTSCSVARGGGREALFSFYCTYDHEDRVAELRDSEFGSRKCAYDAEAQLLSVTASDPGRNEKFAYDAAGNRVSSNGASARFSPTNQLAAIGGAECSSDARGNLTSLPGLRLTYNPQNQLVRAERPGGGTATYGYDPFGRRIWKRAGNTLTRYTWAGETLIQESREVGGREETQEYLYFPGTYALFATRFGSRIYTCHADHLGTPRRLTDEQGEVAWAADYAAFGEARVTRAQVRNPWRFPGHYYDDETGLHYNRFRYYSPALGRYLSRDPVTFLGGLNFYVYVGNNPTNEADPQGLLWGFVKKAYKAATSVVKTVATAAVSAAKAVGGAVVSAAKKAADVAGKVWDVTKKVAKVVLPIVAAVAVGALVVAFAPLAAPLAILAAGAIAGAVGFGLSEVLNNGFCLACIGKAMLKGALVGALAAAPFALLPVTAGVAAFMGAGAVAGGIGYVADYAVNYPKSEWSWGGLALSVGLGAVTAGLGRYIGGKLGSALFKRRGVKATQQARQNLGLKPGRNNVGHGELRIKGQKPIRYEPAVSGRSQPGTLKGNGSYKRHAIKLRGEREPRIYDSEIKIIENAATALKGNPNAQGVLRIYTERPPCLSCRHVIRVFKQNHPNVKVDVQYTGKPEPYVSRYPAIRRILGQKQQ